MEGPIYRLEKVLWDRQEAADFIGPLDLILHLLSKNKIEIRDISVAQILDQYLDWVSKRQELDLEVASDFIAMAAQLLYIKTRMLLSTQDEEALSEMEELMASLEERQRNENYQRVKLGLLQMEECYRRGSAYLTKPPDPLPATGRRYEYHHNMQELASALGRIARRGFRRLPPPVEVFQGVVGREPYPVGKKVSELISRLEKCSRLSLHGLWRESRSRSEVVAVFISVLELCRSGQADLVTEDGEAILCLAKRETVDSA